ncbi:AMP-binding protein [Streptomyces sp. NBC_01190]|uniref:AMP-binding protein n=1 Tax=Streptomyces sp. NBC_01190 TaxID=2903767 RepID=UPI00386E6AE8|nr:AMP-binding protein [Streptomyces sp. NBC_01190]
MVRAEATGAAGAAGSADVAGLADAVDPAPPCLPPVSPFFPLWGARSADSARAFDYFRPDRDRAFPPGHPSGHEPTGGSAFLNPRLPRRVRTGPPVRSLSTLPAAAPVQWPVLAFSAAAPAATKAAGMTDGPDLPYGRTGGPGGPGGTGGGGGGGGTGGMRPGPGDIGRLPGTLLRHRAARRPQTVPALPYPSARRTGTAGCTFAELDRRARAVASRLGALLQPGSRVMLAYPEGPDLAGAFYGCLYAGMAAIPLVLPEPGATGGVGRAVARCVPDLVLTGADIWTPLAVDRTRTQVLEADGRSVAGEPVRRLAQNWRPVGVLRSAPAYHRYHDDGGVSGRLEPAMAHSDLADVMGELTQAIRLGTDEENVGWIAAVHGVEDAVWRILLPVRVSV